MKALNSNVAIAVDGGGIKGLIVAKALVALEKELGDRPLIECPEIKILAGTSTGAILAGALALGMRAHEIAQVYEELGQKVFPLLAPRWIPDVVQKANEIARLLFESSLYTSDRLIKILQKIIKDRTGDPDFTLGQLHERLNPNRPNKSLILTTVNIDERRTHFLKSNKGNCGNWKLWEAILASSSAPAALPVLVHRDGNDKLDYYTDGGVGSYGNPAYVAAKEAVTFRGFAPKDVTVLSFGTGWVNAENYQHANGIPSNWPGISWAMNAPMLLIGDNARAQSVDILADLVPEGLDFRRFQFPLVKDIASDGYADDKTYLDMAKLGDDLGNRVVYDQYAVSDVSDSDPAEYDPEGLSDHLKRYRAAQKG